MMVLDRNIGESVSLVLDGHVIQIKLLKTDKTRARIAIDAPVGAMMYRNERLAKPIEESAIVAQIDKQAL